MKISNSPVAQTLAGHMQRATDKTFEGWEKFQNWSRNHDYLRTVGGLLCISFCLKWGLAGATFAFLSSGYTSSVQKLADNAIANSWSLMDIKQQAGVLGIGIFAAVFGEWLSILTFPIEIVGSICAFKLSMDLAVRNMNMEIVQKKVE